MEKEHLSLEFGAKLYNKQGALLAGAGISIQSGLPSFREMMKRISRKLLHLELTDEDDPAQFAQYVEDEHGRRALTDCIRELVERPVPTNPCHRALSWMNVPDYYTTNFDTLLEQMCREASLNWAVLRNDRDLTRSLPGSHVRIVKLHGDGDDLVVTRSDFDAFFDTRGGFASCLTSEMLKRSFLFIGYSYQDPDVQQIVRRVSLLTGSDRREHYIVIKREADPSQARKQQFWANSIKRHGMACVFIDDYPELAEILFAIARKSRGPGVYVTGSHLDEDAALARAVGVELACAEDVILLDGQSQGVGYAAMDAFRRACFRRREDLNHRTRSFGNPFAVDPTLATDATRRDELLRLRAPLLRSAQAVIVFDGARGTEAEVDGARQLGCSIVPVPQSPSGLAAELAKDPGIQEALERHAPDYLNKLRIGAQITAKDVVSCILQILRS